MELIRYSINEAEIAKMSDIYMGLTVKSLDDEEGLAAVHSARMVVVKHRTSIDKLRKSSNEDAQAFIKNNNNNAKKLLTLIEPIENHLKSEEGKIEAEKARIKAEEDRIAKEKIQKRVDTLFALNVILPFSDVATIPDNEYSALLDKSQANFEDEQRRIAVEKATMAAEEKKLAEERAEIEKIKIEQEARAKAQTEREEALKRQEKAIEDAKRKEIERQEQIAWREREAERLRILAEADAAEKIAKAIEDARIAAEEAETARLLMAELAPDKEKLLMYADKIQDLTAGNLNVKSKKARALFSETVATIMGIETIFRAKIRKL